MQDPEISVSILVFLELAPGLYDAASKAAGYKFQSLFFWNSRPDYETPQRPCPGGGVSILVFLELAPGLRFSSIARPGYAVSILVFLELAPGQ